MDKASRLTMVFQIIIWERCSNAFRFILNSGRVLINKNDWNANHAQV
jgi:hypothetical protein